MTNTKITYRIPLVQIDADLSKQLTAAHTAVRKLEEALVKKYRETDRFQAMKDLAGIHHDSYSARKSEVTPRVVNGEMVCTVFADADDMEAIKKPPVYIDPKTVNLLMNGKILTDAEKRKLLVNIGVDLDALSAEMAGAK